MRYAFVVVLTTVSMLAVARPVFAQDSNFLSRQSAGQLAVMDKSLVGDNHATELLPEKSSGFWTLKANIGYVFYLGGGALPAINNN